MRQVHTIALNEDEEARLQRIIIEGDLSIMDIFRMGLEHAQDFIDRK